MPKGLRKSYNCDLKLKFPHNGLEGLTYCAFARVGQKAISEVRPGMTERIARNSTCGTALIALRGSAYAQLVKHSKP